MDFILGVMTGKKVDKETFIAMIGQLLKETREGADIDRIFLTDQETAEIAYKDPRRMHKRVNIARNSHMEIIKEIIEAIK